MMKQYARLTGKSMAIARLEPGYATQGTPLEVKGQLNTTAIAIAIADTLPFDDPEKTKRTAKG